MQFWAAHFLFSNRGGHRSKKKKKTSQLQPTRPAAPHIFAHPTPPTTLLTPKHCSAPPPYLPSLPLSLSLHPDSFESTKASAPACALTKRGVNTYRDNRLCTKERTPTHFFSSFAIPHTSRATDTTHTCGTRVDCGVIERQSELSPGCSCRESKEAAQKQQLGPHDSFFVIAKTGCHTPAPRKLSSTRHTRPHIHTTPPPKFCVSAWSGRPPVFLLHRVCDYNLIPPR